MAAMRKAVALDPVSPNLTFDAWLVAYLARDFGASRAWCEDFRRLTGADGTRCHLLALLGSGERRQAAVYAERFLRENDLAKWSSDPSVESVLHDYWIWDLGRPREVLTDSQRAFAQARALAQLGRTEEAMDRLRVAATGRAPEMVFARYMPYFDPLSAHPGFIQVTAKGP
jgi:hypothetical protein